MNQKQQAAKTAINQLAIELTDIQAECLAQFLKRLDYSDCRRKATNDDEAYIMQDAASKVKVALAAIGYDPR